MHRSHLLLAMLWTASADTLANVSMVTHENLFDKAATAFICAVAAGFGGYFLAMLRVDQKIKSQVEECSTELTKEMTRIERTSISEARELRSEFKELHREVRDALLAIDNRMEQRAANEREQWQQLNRALGSIEGSIKILQNRPPSSR